MAWHEGICHFCHEKKQVGRIECIGVDSCLDCFRELQNQQKQREELEKVKKAKLN